MDEAADVVFWRDVLVEGDFVKTGLHWILLYMLLHQKYNKFNKKSYRLY